MSRHPTPAAQNGMNTSSETFQNERIRSFPHRHGDTTRVPENQDDTSWKLKLNFSYKFFSSFHTVATKSTFSHEFFHELQNLLPQNRCFMRGCRQFSTYLKKYHPCHGICILPPLDSTLTTTPATRSEVTRRLKPRKV